MEDWRSQHPSLAPFVGHRYQQARLKVMVVGTADTFTTDVSAEDTDEAYREAWYRHTDQRYAQIFANTPGQFWSDHTRVFNAVMTFYQQARVRKRHESHHYLMTVGPKALAELVTGNRPTNGEIGAMMDQVVYFNFFARPLFLARNPLWSNDVLDVETQCDQQDFDQATKRFQQLRQSYQPDLILILSNQVTLYLPRPDRDDQRIVTITPDQDSGDELQVVSPFKYQRIMTAMTGAAFQKAFRDYRFG